MKILIASLQVSLSGSKGHLHPAVELALEAKRKGHEVAILPLPSSLGEEDTLQLQRANIQYISPPSLPKSIIKTPNELAQLAVDSAQVYLAYSSFLIEPIEFQKNEIEKILKEFKPEIILYDLLVYSVPLVGRRLGIPDVGYCSGLKLIAPESLLGLYTEIAKKLTNRRDKIVRSMTDQVHFHHMELLSKNGQFIFAPESLFASEHSKKFKTIFTGALPISKDRSDQKEKLFNLPQDEYVVLSFGSVLDPADFPQITRPIINVCKKIGFKLIVSSKKMAAARALPNHVEAYEYLPITAIITSAQAYIHHGGANSFSEALLLGAKQILIPLTTDQPIQAHYLKKLGAGISIEPRSVNESLMTEAILHLSNKENEVHTFIEKTRQEYQKYSGATTAIDFLEHIISRAIE